MNAIARTFAGSCLVLSLAACGNQGESTTTNTTTTTTTTHAPTVEEAGQYPPGNTTVTIQDTVRNRTLRVEIWYPAASDAKAAADTGAPIEDFVPPGAEHDQLAGLVAKAPDPGTSRRSHAARDAALAAGGPWPIVAFSHCYSGTRYATFAIAERLASHGIAVIAPDHTGGTLADQLAGNPAPINASFLDTRAKDIEVVLDRALDAGATELPASLRGHFDASRVGVFGHSYGGVTAGLVLMQDKRPRAGLAIAVPMENPLLPGVKMSALHVPLLFFLASEDNSIGKIGNQYLEQNYMDANPPVGLVEFADAGHWSFTNICGIIPGFEPGCAKDAKRMTDGTPFQYVDIDVARGAAQAYVTAFFLSTLEDDTAAAAYLEQSTPANVVTAKSRH